MARILISGASVAGPAAAVVLSRAGHSVLVAEIARAPRTGGYAVDFRGKVHLDALERLGVLEDLLGVATSGSGTQFLVGERPRLRLPAEFTSGDLDVLRRDLTKILIDHSEQASYRYGLSIQSLHDTPASVDVTFSDGTLESFDIVIGADGIHSRTRALLFGPDEQFVTHQGYCVAGWSLPNVMNVGRDLMIWNVPGCAMGLSADPHDESRANVFAVFTSPPLSRSARHDRDQQEQLLRQRLSDVGPYAAEAVRNLPDTPDLYLDAIARTDVPKWSQGRCVLLGDAAHGATLGGMGTGTAVVGALVLARELSVDDRHERAFTNYERSIRPYATRCQHGGDTAGRFFAPKTRAGIAARNWFFSTSIGRRMLLDTGRDRSESLSIPALFNHPDATDRPGESK